MPLTIGNKSKNVVLRLHQPCVPNEEILFLCFENAGRAFANYYGKGRLIASRAIVALTGRFSPILIEAMEEKGIGISMKRPKLITTPMAEEADPNITMGCSVRVKLASYKA